MNITVSDMAVSSTGEPLARQGTGNRDGSPMTIP
jgi:hypothetical protein